MKKETQVNFLLDISKTIAGAGLIGIVVKDSDDESKYLIGALLIVTFVVLVSFAIVISKKTKND